MIGRQAGIERHSAIEQRILPKIDELGGRLDEMRGELAEQLDGMRTDLSGLPFVSKST